MSEVRSPYPGLRPFREEEHLFFFGRYEHTTALYRLLDRGRFLSVLGGSGSGKSSLVQAGLLPLLAEEKRAGGGQRWVIISLRPGTHPVDRLATALLKVTGSESETIPRAASGLRRSSHGLAEEVGRLLPADREVLILVDQFEELFRYADAKDAEETGDRDPGVARLAQDDEFRRFVEILLTASTLAVPRIRVILTMRSDFLGDCARYRGLAEAVSANQYLTPRLDRDQQTEAIVGPLLRHTRRLDPDVPELTGTRPEDWSDLIEPQLVEQLKNDAGDDPDQLPVLQHALLRCWQEASGDRLTLALYRSLGGWGVILSNHADQIMESCGDGRAGTVERIFRALTERDRAGRAIRRPRTIAQLVAETGDKEEDIRAVISRFSAPDCSFLVPQTPPDELVDVGHEALIRQWGRIADLGAGWLQKEFRDGLIWQSLLVQAEAHEKNPKDVLSPAATEERQRWFEQHNLSWAERYGGRWSLVDGLVRASIRARRQGQLIRLVLAGVVIAAGTWAFFDQRQRAQEAERLRIDAVATSIGFQLELQDGNVERRDVEALMALAGTGRDERLAFVTELIRRPALAERFARNPAVATRALVGLDPVARRQVIAHAFGPGAVTPENPGSRYARALLGIELAATEAVESVYAAIQGTTDPDALQTLGEGLAAFAPKLTAEQAGQAVAPILAAMQGTTKPDALQALAQGFDALPVELTTEQAEQAITPLLAAIRRTTNPFALQALGQGLAALAPKLAAEQAGQAMAPVLAAIRRTAEPDALKALGQGLAALPIELTPAQARQAITPVIAAMQNATDSDALQTLGQRLAALAPKLTTEQAQQAIAPFLAAMQGATPPYAISALGQGLAALPAELNTEQAEQAITPLLAAIRRTTKPGALEALGQGLAALAPQLTAEQAGQAIAPVVAAIRRTTKPDALEALGQGLAALPIELTAEQAGQAITPVIAAMQNATDSEAMQTLGSRLAALAPRLTTEQAGQAIAPVLAAIQATTDPYALKALGEGLAALAPKLTVEQARQAIAPVLAAIQGTTNPVALQALGQGLAALPVELTADQARQAIAPVLAVIRRTSQFSLEPLGQALAALAPKLTAEQARQAIAPVLATIRKTILPSALWALGRGFATLAAKLTTEQAGQAVAPVLAAIQGTTDSDALRTLGQGLAALAAKLTAEQAWYPLASVLAAIQGATDRDRMAALGQGLTALAPQLTTEQAGQAIAPVLAAIQATTDPYALKALGEGLAALAAKLTAKAGVQALIDAMKIPWMAGEPSEPLQEALQVSLTGKAEPQVDLWNLIAQIEKGFGTAIDLTTPPKATDASAGV